MKYILNWKNKAVLKDDFVEIKRISHPHLCMGGWAYMGKKKDGSIVSIAFGKELKEGDTLEQLSDIIIDGKPYAKTDTGFDLITEDK